VGIAPSKTLAKLANHVAKKQKQYHSVCEFNAMTARMLDNLLAKIEVGAVWGVGRRSAERLQQMGIATVLELKYSPAKRVRAEFGVVMERIVAELNGTACLELDDVTPPRQQIICSRSFGVPVQSWMKFTNRPSGRCRCSRKSSSPVAHTLTWGSPVADQRSASRTTARAASSTHATPSSPLSRAAMSVSDPSAYTPRAQADGPAAGTGRVSRRSCLSTI